VVYFSGFVDYIKATVFWGDFSIVNCTCMMWCWLVVIMKSLIHGQPVELQMAEIDAVLL
jgi:hypothetical protein